MDRGSWTTQGLRPLRELLHRPVAGLVLQTALTGLSIGLIFLFLESLEHAVIAASLASSSFLVFLVPHSRLARSRSVLLGHLLGIVPGYGLGSLIPHTHVWAPVLYGAVVIATGLLMELTASSHPPAVGTSLGLAIAPQLWPAVSILVGALVLAAAHEILHPRLLDITEHPELEERLSLIPTDEREGEGKGEDR